MKNILLVYPKIPKTYWGFEDSLSFIGKKASMPPLGLITIAAMLPEKYNLKLVDMNIQELKNSHLQWADTLFTSSMIIQKDSLENVIQKANNLGKRIVAGGPFPTQHYDKIKGEIDHYIIGEAESGVLNSFIEDIEKGNAKKAYANPIIRKNPKAKKIDEKEIEHLLEFFGEDIDMKLAQSKPEMKKTPVPRYDLLDIEKYGSMAVQMSRGCPFNCDFCSEPALFGNSSRLKSSDKLVKELEMIYGLGYSGGVFVVDDNFIGNITKVKDVLPEIKKFQKKHNYPFGLFTEASINLAWDEELMKLMRDAGFNMVFVGVESPDKEVLKSMNKHHNLKMEPIEAVRNIQKYGIEVSAGFIVGNDNEPEDICGRIYDFCQEAGIPTAMVGLLAAMKGSQLHYNLDEEGRLLEGIGGNNTHNFGFNFRQLQGVDEEKTIKRYKKLLARLYDKNGKNYFQRCKNLLDHLGDNKNFVRKVGYTEIKALTRSLLKQTFSSYGRNYLNFMGYAIKNHMRVFPEAVRLAVYGHHFINITKESLKAHHLQEYLLKNLDNFRERWSSKKEIKEEFVQRFILEKNRFLIKAKKQIKKIPKGYKENLIKTYKNVASALENIH